MDSKSELLNKIEDDEEYGLLPDNVEDEAYKLLESNDNIDREIVSYALDVASDYWKKHIEDKGQVVSNQQGVRINFEDNFDNDYMRDLTRDIYNEWEDQLEIEDVSELAQTLTTLPEDSRFENVPWDYDPKLTPEDHDHPSMFQ